MKTGWEELESHIKRRRGGKQWKVVEKHVLPVMNLLKDKNGNLLYSEVCYV